MTIFLGGGGDTTQSRLLDGVFAAALLPGPVVYIPVALDSPTKIDAAATWFTTNYAPLGIREVIVWRDLAERPHASDIGGIYIGGGNTYRLLHLLREGEVLPEIIRHAQLGTPIYGGSAGAIALGADITTSALCGDVRPETMTDFSGADLLNGWSVACHYTPAMNTDIDSWRLEHALAGLIALAEDAGAEVSHGTLRNVGSTVITLYSRHNTIVVRPGESHSL
jgi:dipeptidase E